MNTKYCDNELLNDIFNGGVASEEILYNKYKKILTAYIKNKYPTIYDYEDIVSDVLIKVFLNLSNYKTKKGRFKSWVFTILKNHLIDVWKKNKIDLQYGDVYFEKNITDNDFTYWSETFYQDNMKVFCIETKINEGEFGLLELKYLHGYSYEDISCYYNSTPEILSNKVNHIKNKIKKTTPQMS